MKPKYEISIWEDVLSEDGKSFKEKKIAVLGSNSMTSESRARDPKLVNNINGTNTFTFNVYASYIDTQTGEKVKNPYVPYLINERKIKVFWKDEWYDLLIKQIKEDSVNHLFSYVCEDSYVTELSRTGFDLTFDTELENNIGTAEELVEKVIENTDWRINKNDSDKIYQETEEAVYESTTISDRIPATQDSDGQLVYILKNKPILIYYSCAPDINNLKSSIQFYYDPNSNQWMQDNNDMLVINGNCYSVDVTWKINGNLATAQVGKNPAKDFFVINFATGISKQYRAKRYVQSQKMVYNKIVGRYVNVYNNGNLLGYNTTEFNDALSVINLFANPSNFKNISGWTGTDLYFKLYPEFNQTTQVASYHATSYLWLKGGQVVFNDGIRNNRPYIPNGFIKDEKYILRIRAKSTLSSSYLSNFNTITPTIQSRDNEHNPTGINYFTFKSNGFKDNWLEYTATCVKSCPYDKILSSSEPFGFFLQIEGTGCWLEEIQFFREVYGDDGRGNLIRINPNMLNTQSIAQQYWKYFLAQQSEETTKDNLIYEHISIGEWAEAKPVYNDYQRYGTIKADNSNRFNILQTIAETFECWICFKIEHDNNGYIIYDNNGLPCKWVCIKRETGQETGIGFIYGIDLKGIVRNIKSDKISTKTIVEQNENEFGKNGFCSIARSEQNYPRENFIYNFDYYIQHGLLEKDALYNDLYSVNGYYYQLHALNTEYAKNLELLTNKKIELTKQNAMMTVYGQYISSIEDEINSIMDSLMKLSGATTYAGIYNYASSHYNDTKVQSLINDKAQLENTLSTYKDLKNKLQLSLDALNEYINIKNNRQIEIIQLLTEANKQFYIKYSRFIQEGTWTSENYWDDDLYYLDALQVAYQSSRPQISYDINVLRLSDLEDYSSKVFKLGDISFIQDVEYFGYKEDKITPYKEQVILTEITSYFDTPDKDTIKVQNYKSHFDDLFQRITATVQNLEFSQGKYAKAANIISTDGTIKSSIIQNTFDSNKDLVYGAQNESATIDNTGITVIDNDDASKRVKVTSGGIFVTNDGGNTWKNAVRGDGISTDLLTAGKINTEQITVYNGNYPSFRWDSNGLNAYKFFNDGRVDTTQFVRFDQYGIYGIKNGPDVYIPKSEDQIYQDANFGLTWNKFFMKSSSGGKFIEISTERDIVVNDGKYNRVLIGRVDWPNETNYGIRINNGQGKTVFQCDDKGSFLSGWTLTPQYLESTLIGANEQSIRIYADGNIGCYGHEASTYQEDAYIINKVSNSFSATGLNVANATIAANEEIYVFVNSIGKISSQRQVSGKYNSKYDTPTAEYKPTPSTENVQFLRASNKKNYIINSLTWSVSFDKATHKQDTVTTVVNGQTITSYVTTYTYYYKLVAYSKNKAIFTISSSTSIQNNLKKYLPKADTKWCIDNTGDAIFHNITADGGKIAGWWIDDEKIYQTTNGKRDGPIKTQLNSNGTAKVGSIDYSIITDAINAAMANIGGVLMSSGLINGYNIAQVAATANEAYGLAASAASAASSAAQAAADAKARANSAHAVAEGARAAATQHGHGVETSSGDWGWTTGTYA